MTNATPLPTMRKAAFAAGLVALSGLVLRIVLSTADTGLVGGALSYLSQFFTILTNGFVALMMVWIASGRVCPPVVLLAVTVAIAGVGLVYHLVLAQLWDPEGWLLVADHLVHTVVPLITVAFWLAFADKMLVQWWMAPAAMIWPLLYCAYALVRAEWSGFYPYPFLNLSELGALALITNVVGLAMGFTLLAGVLILVGKTMSGSENRERIG